MQLWHLFKTIASGSLVLFSLLWLAVQQLILPSNSVEQQFVTQAENVNFLQFKRDWCRVRSKRISWREMLEPCQEKPFFMLDARYATNPSLSHVSQVIANPAGEHSKIRIDTYTGHGVLKTFGGDSLRVTFRGPDVVAATVFDLQNGSYDALALLLTPGEYSVHVMLDYTQCNGLKDPPVEWYVKAHCAGSHNRTVPPEISSEAPDYINKLISSGLQIFIAAPRYDLKDLESIISGTDCGFSCSRLWDGYGVWSNEGKTWKPYVKESKALRRHGQRSYRQRSGTLWIYGDSISYYLHHRLSKKQLCQRLFKKCENTYNWVYPKVLYELRHFCKDIDVDIPKIRSFFKEVVYHKNMDENSVLLFNLGAHFVKNTSFKKYREIIEALIDELKSFKGKAIWKSTTAIHHQQSQIMGAFRRFLTSQRVLLFNAYANAAFCNAGINLLDVFPVTASYPNGTKDGVHYHANASAPIESFLHSYFEA